VEILGVGPLEIVVILIVALLIFGPDRLPEIGASLGKAVRELRNLSREVTQGMDSARQAVVGPIEELSRPFQEASQAVQDVTQAAGALSHPAQALEKALVGQLASPRPSGAETGNTIAPPAAGSNPPSAAEPDGAPTPIADAGIPAASAPSEGDANLSPATEVEAPAGPAVSETDETLTPSTDTATPAETSTGEAGTARAPLAPAPAEPQTPNWEI
jgi:sec-independent protein translocase protein TatB